jgi:predicted  nucleic acid-binding Zn-ribbon protein
VPETTTVEETTTAEEMTTTAEETTTITEETTMTVEEAVATEDSASTGKGQLVVEIRDEITNEPVEGAVVEITGPDGTTVKLVTNKDGKVFGDFEAGEYVVKVVEVPEGYTVTTGKEILVTIVNDRTTEHVAAVTKPDGQLGDDESGHLPITGKLVWPITVMSILGLAMMAAGVIDNKKRKNAK